MESRRQLVQIVSELCKENGIKLECYSADWLLRLEYKQKSMFVHCYKFPNNNASCEQLCDDKSSLSEFLCAKGIACIPHFYLYCYGHVIDAAQYEYAQSLLNKYGKLVVKPNSGTCGTDVFYAENKEQLFNALDKVCIHTEMLAISPYRKINAEYRAVVFNGKVIICFEKKLTPLVGDGVSTIGQLALARGICADEEAIDYVPKIREEVYGWKHNLCFGAVPQKVEESVEKRITELALKAAKAVDINFASVDIADDGQLTVLEINSGVMLEKYAAYSAENYIATKKLYYMAIAEYLGIGK